MFSPYIYIYIYIYYLYIFVYMYVYIYIYIYIYWVCYLEWSCWICISLCLTNDEAPLVLSKYFLCDVSLSHYLVLIWCILRCACGWLDFSVLLNLLCLCRAKETSFGCEWLDFSGLLSLLCFYRAKSNVLWLWIVRFFRDIEYTMLLWGKG